MPDGESEIDELRRRHDERLAAIGAEQRRLREVVWYVAIGNALGVALLALTATRWQTANPGIGRSAWRTAYAVGFPAWVAVALVVLLAVGTLAVSVVERAPAPVYRALAVLGVLTVGALSVLAAVLPRTTSTSAGLWVTMVVSGTLVVVHLNRAANRTGQP